MPLIDMHSHWGTQRGYVLRTQEELAQQKKTWNSETKYVTEQELADYFRASNARVVLDLGFTKFVPLEEARALHDYSFEMQRAHPDVVLGNWFHIDPVIHGRAGLAELRRCSCNCCRGQARGAGLLHSPVGPKACVQQARRLHMPVLLCAGWLH